ncbi:MAG: class I SAM-dependent methyltransferase [Candidatus Electryonea clarkiae]|nr:class I SAM-dependent methyltransferase [Candidatus Electryonea clarkiae]MDP8285837.1 class I SAM-dependent methyltransferase [Candidatus Electryonea clarkiae]
MEGSQLNPTSRFSDRVKNYVRYRPGYPKEIIEFLVSDLGLTSDHVIADIGSGTGIFTNILLDNGNIVYAVEPNREMRDAAEKLLLQYDDFRSVSGTAEDTLIPDSSIDFITVAQAFHWFDIEKAGIEFKRILKPGGTIMLVWNKRRTDDSHFAGDYERLINKFGTDYNKVDHRNFHRSDVISSFYADNGYNEKDFYNFQEFDFDGLSGRLVSSSYIPDPQHPAYLPMIQELKDLFDKYKSEEGMVKIDYDTVLFWGNV